MTNTTIRPNRLAVQLDRTATHLCLTASAIERSMEAHPSRPLPVFGATAATPLRDRARASRLAAWALRYPRKACTVGNVLVCRTEHPNPYAVEAERVEGAERALALQALRNGSPIAALWRFWDVSSGAVRIVSRDAVRWETMR